MSAYLRSYFVLAALLTPAVGSDLRAEHDWRPIITQPSSWDWLPGAAFLPNLGRVRVPAAEREG